MNLYHLEHLKDQYNLTFSLTGNVSIFLNGSNPRLLWISLKSHLAILEDARIIFNYTGSVENGSRLSFYFDKNKRNTFTNPSINIFINNNLTIPNNNIIYLNNYSKAAHATFYRLYYIDFLKALNAESKAFEQLRYYNPLTSGAYLCKSMWLDDQII